MSDARPWLFGEREIQLTADERFRWGECPVCGAPHGTACYAAVGLQLGRRVSGEPMRDGDGAHLGRLERAPFTVRIERGRTTP